MIEYRPFRNTDPPGLCRIWHSRPPLRALYQPLTPSVLEMTVLSKPFFDRDGLIVAVEDGKPIGFAHAGFATTLDGSGLDSSVGATCMLVVSRLAERPQVARDLLARSEQYLRDRGARQLYAGGSWTVAPFYLGLYGGAALSGVMGTDEDALQQFTEAGYAESGRKSILQRQLAGWRPAVDRQQIQLRRVLPVRAALDPPSQSWWEACTTGLTDQYCFIAGSARDENPAATAVFWDIEPLASSWGVRARGLSRLWVPPAQDRDAVALYLIGEALRRMASEGVSLAEAHVDIAGDPLHGTLTKLGFQEVEQAVELTKVVAP
jgi:GNAT superfamily N-acetyltransferase